MKHALEKSMGDCVAGTGILNETRAGKLDR